MIGLNGGLIGSARVPSFSKETGIWTPREYAAYKSSGQWSADPYYRSGKTLMMLHMNGANNSTTFTDSSTFATAVTANGNAKISTTQSKFNGSSAYFDGSGDFLSTGSVLYFDFSKEAFTFEFWLYPVAFPTSGNFCRVLMFGPNGTPSSFVALQFDSNGTVYASVPSGGTSGIVGGTLTLNTWQHYAVTLNGNNSKIFLNGIQTASGTITQPTSQQNSMRIGYDTVATVNFNYNGYIDELRITRGVALYTSNFTPAAAPFPDA